MKITIHLPRDEYCALRALAALASNTVAGILEQFAADLAKTDLTSNEDAQDSAQDWLQHRYGLDDTAAEDVAPGSADRCRRAYRWRAAVEAMEEVAP